MTSTTATATTVAAPPALELSGVRKTFHAAEGTVVALEVIDLVVGVGEVVALLGPNGAGKTTTLDIVLGLSEPTSGTARVLGRGPREAVVEGRVTAVLQTGGLLDDLTVRETVRYVAAIYEGRGHSGDVDAVLERAGLTALARRRVSRCSGGEQQRLRFALALLPDPEILVLDEPSAGMDVATRRAFWSTMHAEARRGRTVVFATHYLEEADDFADRVVLVSHGRVIADGSTAWLRSTVSGRVVRAEVDDPGAVRRALLALDSTADVQVEAHRVVVRTSDSDAVARLLLTELGARDLEVAAGSLEDAFVHLTGPSAITAPRDENHPTDGDRR